MTTITLPITEKKMRAVGGIGCEADSIATVPLAEERSFAYWQQDIPRDYLALSADEISARIAEGRRKLGSKLIVLGHHYQRADVIAYADLRGDSFKLAQWAAGNAEAEYIIFCGVHFMAEAADILSAPHQKVILPNLAAGCSMSDMADPDDVYNAWAELEELGIAQDTLPITYMNSAAALKAFVGEHGGAVCTSSNAAKVLEWAFAQKKRVLFFPDQHLGRNTGAAMGVPLEQMVLWGWARPYGSMGGQTLQTLQDSRIILWAGHCSVHQRFTPAQIADARANYPDITVIVHPECRYETVQAADLNGSTEFITRTITDAPAGARFAVGTEINLVSRLAKENPDKTVFCLDPVVCPCSTMYRVHPAYLAWAIEALVDGHVINQIAVPDAIAANAKLALDRMLRI